AGRARQQRRSFSPPDDGGVERALEHEGRTTRPQREASCEDLLMLLGTLLTADQTDQTDPEAPAPTSPWPADDDLLVIRAGRRKSSGEDESGDEDDDLDDDLDDDD